MRKVRYGAFPRSAPRIPSIACRVTSASMRATPRDLAPSRSMSDVVIVDALAICKSESFHLLLFSQSSMLKSFSSNQRAYHNWRLTLRCIMRSNLRVILEEE